jgi:hypothetical protein
MCARFAVAFVLVLSSLVYGQEEAKPGAVCTGKHNENLTYMYALDVMQQLQPPGDSLILVSVSADSESKLVLRISQPPTAYELWRGVPEENLYNLLLRLQDSCLLPPNPYEAVKLVRIKWQRLVLPRDSFQTMYNDFSLALAQYSSAVATRPATIRGGRVVLHSAEYRVAYESSGFEQFELRAFDDTEDPSKMNPIVRWARGLQKFSDDGFKNNKQTSRRKLKQTAACGDLQG